jgi:DNA repair exonuclease SbcCD ATPase subunit
MAKADVLAIVADQFDDIRHRLDVQLTRTGQVQEQLDRQRKEMVAQHKEMVALRKQFTELQRLLKAVLKVPIVP